MPEQKKAALNYSTSVPVNRTITELQTILAGHGANRVMVNYADGDPSGLTFSLPTPHGARAYTLPVDVDAMQRILIENERDGLLRSGGAKAARTSREQAARVAWRVIKDWLEAQLALVATRMAALDQVMLPYHVIDSDERTLYAAWREREDVLELEAGRG